MFTLHSLFFSLRRKTLKHYTEKVFYSVYVCSLIHLDDSCFTWRIRYHISYFIVSISLLGFISNLNLWRMSRDGEYCPLLGMNFAVRSSRARAHTHTYTNTWTKSLPECWESTALSTGLSAAEYTLSLTLPALTICVMFHSINDSSRNNYCPHNRCWFFLTRKISRVSVVRCTAPKANTKHSLEDELLFLYRSWRVPRIVLVGLG